MSDKTAPDSMSARDFFQQDDAALAAAVLGEEKPVVEKEKFVPVKKEEKVEAAEEIKEEAAPAEEAVEAEEAEAADETVEAAEGEEAAPAEGDDKTTPVLQDRPITEFLVTDAHGPLQIPDLTIKFKAVGKERELRLDHLVRMAQMGFTNEERENQVAASKKFVAEKQEENESLRAQLEKYDAQVAALLENPDAYETARMNWERVNSPEARAARTEAENRNLRAAQHEQKEQRLVESFIMGTLDPFTTKLLADNPNVSQYELIGRFTELTGPLLVKGRVPVNRLPEVERIVKADLAEWVQARELERASSKKEQVKKDAAKVKQIADQKRANARIIAAPGKAAPPKQAKTTFKSARDWLDSQFEV